MESDLLPSGYEQVLYQVATLASVKPTVDDAQSLHSGLILQTLEKLGCPAVPETIRDAIHRSTGIALTVEATVAAIGGLLKDKHVVQGQAFGVALTPEKTKELTSQAERFKRLRQLVVDRWLDELDAHLSAQAGKGISALERLQLDDDLNVFLLQLVRYHGAEVALFLYPEAAGNRAVLEIDEKELFRSLPRRADRLQDIRTQALPAFVREAGTERADYIAALLHRAALVQILQADPTASAIFSEVLGAKVLFLDTNFVFRLFGLQGDQLRASAREVLDLGRQLGHRFKVSTRTYEELQGLVQRQADWLAAHGHIPEPLAATAADFVAGNDYVSSYWRDRGRYSTLEQFRTAYSQLSLLLENFEIEISKDLVADITGTPDLREAVSNLKVFKPSHPDLLVEHDAFHKVLIERLRVAELGRQPDGWHDARFIFLTFDNILPLFAAQAAQRRKGHRVPFCIMSHEWLQVLYFVRPTSAITAEVFVSLVNSPYLEGYFSRRALNRDIVREIVGTMGEMREFRAPIARRILADRTLTSKLDAEKRPNEREFLIREAVRLEALSEDTRLSDLLKKKDRDIQAMKAELATKEQTIRDVEAELREQRQVVKHKGAEGTKKREALVAERAELRKQLTNSQSEVADLRSLVTGYEALSGKVDSLGKDLQTQRDEAARARRWLLLIPVLLIVYAIGRLFTGERDDLVVWVALLIGLAPIVRGIRTRFRGREWDIVGRAANLLGIAVFAWEYVPGIKSWAQRLVSLLDWR